MLRITSSSCPIQKQHLTSWTRLTKHIPHDGNRMQWNAPISGYPVAESIAADRDKGVCKTH